MVTIERFINDICQEDICQRWKREEGKMKLRKATIGVRHKGCWGSLCTLQFPNVVMKEKGPINVERLNGKVRVSATWEVSFSDNREFKDFLKHLEAYNSIEKIKVIEEKENSALLRVEWTARKSSYDIVLKNNCLFTSPVTQKEGFEIYEVITENPEELVKILNELEEIGEAKLFSVGRVVSESIGKLTEKQARAIQMAVAHDFYDWPRKASLDEIAAMVGMKRRTFQENLRKAEAKLLPELIKGFFVGK